MFSGLCFASPLYADSLAVLWEIGKEDASTAEFALAPSGYDSYERDGAFVVGVSDPRRDWPYVHPGPEDNWAGSGTHTFKVAFGLKAAPSAGDARLLVGFADTHARLPPRMEAWINGRTYERVLPAGGGNDSIEGRPGSFRPFVRELGAAGDGVRLDTKALQEAIDRVALAGGGTVHVRAGRYLTGTLVLKDDVALHLDSGAVLLGSTNLEHYPSMVPSIRSYTDNYTERSLIYAEGRKGVAIQGRGAIDGQGRSFRGPYKMRPYLMRFVSCTDVSVEGIALNDSPMWVQHYLACDGVSIRGIRVRSRVNANNDGIDIDGSSRVLISDCDIQSGDDAIVLKSTLDRPCRHVAISNCLLMSDCNAFKLGTESNGGFENIVVSGCAIHDTGHSGIAIELVDGGVLDGIGVSNIVMRNVRSAIFIRLGNRARPFEEGKARPGMGRLRRVAISNVIAEGADRIGCSITGLPGSPAEDIALENIRIAFSGGGTEADAAGDVPEHAGKYPEYSMFGVLPAYGFYCRHVRGLRLSNVRLEYKEPEARPALFCEDVADLEVFGWKAAIPGGKAPSIRLRDARDVLIHGTLCPAGASSFLRVEGSGSGAIRILASDLSGARLPVETAGGAPEGAVTVK